MIAAISTDTREVMLLDGTVLPIIRLYDGENAEVADWEDAKSFLCGPHFVNMQDLDKRQYYKVEIDALTVAEVAN